MSEKTLLASLGTFAGIRDEFVNMFEADMSKLLTMGHKLRFEDRFSKVQNNLFEYFDGHNLDEDFMSGVRQESGTGGVVMTMMLKELCPTYYKPGV